MGDAAPADSGDLSVQALGPDAQKAPERPRITSPEEASKLSPGTSFIGPDDKERVVPYKVERPEQIANLPDGVDFVGPDGKLRQKPRYEGIDFTAQTLYDMSVNDKERKRALERSYKGKVRDDPAGGFYIEDDDGVSRKPGRGLSKVTGAVASSAAPTILSVLGALGGGAVGTVGGATAGSVVPVAGTIAGGIGGGTAGAAAGGAGGAMLGQGFNDIIMGLSGTYDRTRGEEATEMALAGMGGMAGAGVGRGVSTLVPSLRSGLSAATSAAPGLARSIAGIKTAEQKADLTFARELAEKTEKPGSGVLGALGINESAVPPSSYAPELPHQHNIVEVFDPAFHTNKPLLESATAHYEKSAGEILRTMGIKDPGTLTKPIADIPTREAGEALMRRTLGELAGADEKMQAALASKKAALEGGLPTAQAQRETVLKAAEEARAAAQKVIDAGYKDIDTDIKTGMKIAGSGHNSGDLWGAVGQKLVAVRRAVGERATVMYDAADQAAGGHLPNIEGLPHQAGQFLEQLPPDFQSKYPDIVRKMRDLAGVPNPPKGSPGHNANAGEWLKEPVNPTFGQLHNMRSQMRANINYSDLTPDIREGTYKFFASKVDQILHGVNETAESAPQKFEPRNFEIFKQEFPKAAPKKAADDPRLGRIMTGIEPLASELDKKFPSLAKQLRDIKSQLAATNDNIDIDEVWDRLDQSLSLIERNAGKSELTERMSKMLTDIGESQDAPHIQHMINQQELNGAYKAYKETFEAIVDPNASWQKHTDLRRMLESLEEPYRGHGNAAYDHAEKTAWEDGAKVLRSRLGGGERQEALKEASRLLKDADRFYADNIKLFNAQQVKAVMRGLESGEPADPANLYNVVVKSGQTELTQAIKDKVGPNLWAGVKAADMTAMLDASKTLVPDVIDGRAFAKQVLERHRNNTLEVVHGREATDKLLEQARRIEMLDGRLDIPVRPGDTVTQVIARARQAEEVAKAEARRDPLGALGKEMRKVEIDHKREAAKMAADRRKDPLGFLYNPTTGASEAVDKILGSEDLILASAAKFGEQSPEFEMLRQVWAQRLLTGGMRPGAELAKVSPEVQQIMFPGVTLKQAQTLAKEMDFLLDTKANKAGSNMGTSLSAVAKVEHPWGSGMLGKGAGAAARLVPGSTFVARSALGAYYKTMRTLMTSPALLRWLEKGLNGSPADREAVRQSIGAVLQKGGAVGAGAGEAAAQGTGPE